MGKGCFLQSLPSSFHSGFDAKVACMGPPPHGRLGPGCWGGGVSGEALPHPPPPQRVLERAEEACLSPGALGEGFKVSHQDVDIFVCLYLQYLKYCHCAWISKQPCEFPCQPVTSFLAARNLCIFIALRSAGIQGHLEAGATRGNSQRAAMLPASWRVCCQPILSSTIQRPTLGLL